ncbi:hypothetical protein KR767_12525 [Luteibacter anthropi]|uniref:Lipoprotein n=1 Tax=Luteibacter anthropi TaxID=564369 RepID=A0A7X5UA48_9GAMM|nr:hypothetical protein [Luteibacter anthropi]NII06720.1 hypothetical protein [Luteibacter anthropi]URX60917.1 hypothetical protein KR767_12525 [Luteibacter anthropi]
MRKFVLAASVALTAALALSACNKSEDTDQAATQQEAAVSKPSDPKDTKAWSQFFGQIVRKNMQGMTADRPFPYFVPAGDDQEGQDGRQRQLDNVQGTVARGVTPGNMLVFGGPESAKTADLIVEAFKNAQPGTFKNVIVLFIGDQADQQRVADALASSGATYRFVAM